MITAAIQWGQIGKVIWVSALMGILVIVLFALSIYGGSRAGEARRTGSGSATAFGALSVIALVAFGATVVFAITVILKKS